MTPKEVPLDRCRVARVHHSRHRRGGRRRSPRNELGQILKVIRIMLLDDVTRVRLGHALQQRNLHLVRVRLVLVRVRRL